MQKLKKTYTLVISILAFLGLIIMSYLTYIHYTESKSFCDISTEVSCDVVTTSIYSEIFGLPMSLLGVFYFLTALAIGLFKPTVSAFRNLFFISLLVLFPSLYLTFVEIAFIKSICILCESSKLLIIAILITSFLAIRSSTTHLGRLSVPVIIAGVVLSTVVYFAQTGVVVKKDYSDFVAHLNEQGWVYYKSYTCSNCRRQEKLLGPAYKELNSVECHPEGPNGNPQLCLEKKITKTPTWLLEKDGNEKMRLEGLQRVEELMRVSNYQLKASP